MSALSLFAPLSLEPETQKGLMTMRKNIGQLLASVLVLSLMAAACGGNSDETADSGIGELTPVTLRLQWFPQAQFAGYYAAKDLGFYQDAGLDVTILDHSAPDSASSPVGSADSADSSADSANLVDSPDSADPSADSMDSADSSADAADSVDSASGPAAADFEVLWVPRGLARRAGGDDIVNIAQVFQRNGVLQVSFADSGIAAVSDLKGRTVGYWGSGNEAELLAGLRENGLDPDTDVELVLQGADMSALLSGEIDTAQAMVYNEYAQVLATVDPNTGELYQPEDFNVISWNEEGTAMLQDALWADAGRLENDGAYRETAAKFVEASLRGWVHCRDEPDECVQIVLDQAVPDSAAGSDGWSLRGKSHQKWQLNEVNALIWPSPLGVGTMDPDLWAQTVEVANSEGVIAGTQDPAQSPSENAYRTDIAEQALANLRDEGLDVTGDNWKRFVVELNEGGQ